MIQTTNLVGEKIRTCLPELLKRFPAIDVLYLFGSQATGDAGELSDVDVAVFASAQSPEAPLFDLELGVWLQERLKRRVDVVLLNQASPVLQHEVLSSGLRLYERDAAQRGVLELHVFKRFLDIRHYQRQRIRWRQHG